MNNLVLIRPPTSQSDDIETDRKVNPIGFATKVIAKYYPQEFVTKVYSGYHRGDASPKGVIDDFMRGDVPLFRAPDWKHYPYEAGLKYVYEAFKPPQKYRPVHFADLRFYPWELSTSAEEPLVSNPTLIKAVQQAHKDGKLQNTRMSKNTLYNAAFGYNRNYVHTIKEANPKTDFRKTRTHFYDCTAHARAHLTPIEDPAKTRMVFGVPWLFLMVELMLLWPLMNWLRKGLTPIAWTYEIMNGGMKRINAQTQPNDLYLCLDWSKFDKKARYVFIDKIHEMWKGWMNMSNGYIPTVEYSSSRGAYSPGRFQQRINNLWKWMTAYLKDMDIVLPDGSAYRKSHAGIASGYMQTQILDSFYNLFMLITILIHLGFEKPGFVLVLGDDSIIILRNYGDVDGPALLIRIAEMAEKLFGATLNVDKSLVTSDPNKIHFLGYRNQNGTPIRDPEELLSKLVHPEREWNTEKVKARALGFAFANCGVNENIHLVCKEIFESLSHVTLRESGSPFLRYYRENIDDYSLDVFPTQESLLNRLASPPDRTKLDEKFWPSWFFTSTH